MGEVQHEEVSVSGLRTGGKLSGAKILLRAAAEPNTAR